MATRLMDYKDRKTVTWTVSHSICVGYSDCEVCGKETPEPTMERMIEFAKHDSLPGNDGRGFMWPDDDKPGCWPPEWTTDGEGHLCPECTEVKNNALATRRKAL